jgi:glucose dehydrogenase
LAAHFSARFHNIRTKTQDNAADWPMYTRDLAGTRYSQLKQIDTGNIGTLTQAWSYKLRTAAPTGRGGAGRGNGGGPNAQANAGALAAIGKTGWMFIFDRVTGKPVFGVEE